MTIRYAVRRSCRYQSAEVEASITVAMEVGDSKDAIFKSGMKHLIELVEPEADSAITALCEKAQSDPR